MTTLTVLIAGGGIGGLAAALACARGLSEGPQGDCTVRLLERAQQFSEVGAGIQLGPNAVRVLSGWGLMPALEAVAVRPKRLLVRSAASGAVLAAKPLAGTVEQRYGAPYLTVHRADLHALLLRALRDCAGVQLLLDQTVTSFQDDGTAVTLTLTHGQPITGDVLIAADGLWSTVRQQLLADGPPRFTGHLAYRTLLHQLDLPQAARSMDITAWLGPRFHAVSYPVRGGEWLNLVCVVVGPAPVETHHWDHAAHAANLGTALHGACPDLLALVHAAAQWRLWPLSDRPPMTTADQHARGRVALLGDAAHPMRPYLAQGAAMGIEDAAVLATALHTQPGDIAQRLHRYANQRWQRNARVQARSKRNGVIFHADGAHALARNAAMTVVGPSLLDLPWLYGGGPG